MIAQNGDLLYAKDRLKENKDTISISAYALKPT